MEGSGDPAGTRTQDNSIKSRVLYQLSYGIISSVCVVAPLSPLKTKGPLNLSLLT